MSEFERELVRLCMTECVRIRGSHEACTETTHVIASVLSSSIAMLMGGNEAGSLAVAQILAAELPEMVRRRAASFRQTFGGPEPNRRSQ